VDPHIPKGHVRYPGWAFIALNQLLLTSRPDFDIHGGFTTVQQVLVNWESILLNASIIDTGFIVLEHDLFQQTVEIATGYILPDALAHQPHLTLEPVIECLNLNAGDAYIETNDNTSNPLPITCTSGPFTLATLVFCT